MFLVRKILAVCKIFMNQLCHFICAAATHRHHGQRVYEHFTVAFFAAYALIQYTAYAPVGLAADKTAETLFEADYRLGQAVITKRIASLLLDALKFSLQDRRIGGRKRQTDDDQQ